MPFDTSLIGARPLKTRARRADGGYHITGRKMFALMLEAADFVLVAAYPEGATNPSAGIILMLPREAEGRSVDPNWDVLGMRATRSDSLILDECWLPESAAVFCSDDMRRFRHSYLNWFWGSYTPVYLGVAQAAFEAVALLRTRPVRLVVYSTSAVASHQAASAPDQGTPFQAVSIRNQ